MEDEDFDAPPKMSMDLFHDLGLDFEPPVVSQVQPRAPSEPPKPRKISTCLQSTYRSLFMFLSI
jgi:hypothetical protein